MTPPPNARVSGSQLVHIGRRLSSRDLAILRFLSQHRYATTGQVRRMFFTQHATAGAGTRAAVRVLDRLLVARVLGRLDREVGGHRRGSSAYIWYLDGIGERLTRPQGAPRRFYADPSLQFLAHILQITETHIQIIEAAAASDLAVKTVEIEHESWRAYPGADGGTRMLKPDLFVTVAGIDYDDHWYLEIDRGTESLPVLLAKSRAYAAYRRTGRAQAEHGVFPRVLWVVPTERRVARLRAALARNRELKGSLFVVITPEQLSATIREPPGT